MASKTFDNFNRLLLEKLLSGCKHLVVDANCNERFQTWDNLCPAIAAVLEFMDIPECFLLTVCSLSEGPLLLYYYKILNLECEEEALDVEYEYEVEPFCYVTTDMDNIIKKLEELGRLYDDLLNRLNAFKNKDVGFRVYINPEKSNSRSKSGNLRNSLPVQKPKPFQNVRKPRGV
jgi:hypothetical protein